MLNNGVLLPPELTVICAGLGLSVVVGLVILKQHIIDKLSPTLYMGSVLTGLLIFHLLFHLGDFLWGYLLVHGIVVIRLSGKRNVVTAFSFCLAYLLSIQFWGQGIGIQQVGEGLLFVLIGWVGFILHQNRVRIEEIMEENRELVAKVDEAQLRLREYVDELEETSRRDYLTGLYNISGFQEQVTKSVARCEGGNSYHVICIELVNFEKVVMRKGIDEGDQLLICLARELKEKLPPYGQVTRYDGNKFAVGLLGDDTTLKNCMEVMETIINQLDEQTQINCCMAHSTYPLDASSASELIRLAEQRLSIEQRLLRRMEEEHTRHLEKLSAVGQLAAGLAHEIRNPLTSIRGFIQISALESKEVKKWESIILPEIDRINDLLNQFLNLSDARPARYTKFRLDQLITDVVRLLQPKAFLMGYKLVLQKSSSPLFLEADAEQLKQVLINLVQNGLDSLDQKGESGRVHIRWKELREQVSIRVQDNGNGIQSEHLSRIFDPFFSTKGDGTGMGLYICHRIVAEHGGEIHVTSQPNLGTTFSIHLPLQKSKRKKVNTAEKEKRRDRTPVIEELKESV